MHKRALIPTLAAAAMLAPATAASAASFAATLSAPTHHPKANRFWPVTVTAKTHSGKPLHATATYQFVYQGQVVQTRYPSPNANPTSACSKAGTCRHSPWPFYGRMRDGSFVWPARAVGIPLTLRVVVTVKGRGTVRLNYAVRVRR